MAADDDATVTGWALAAKAGDRAAAAAFIRATQAQVHRFLASLVHPREAEDLTQETYLRAMRSLPRFAGRSSARTWLYAIARRVAVDHHRAAGARPKTADDDLESAAGAVPDRFDDRVALRELIDRLDPDRRAAFVATQVLGLSYAEAAEVCDCPIGTVRSRVARARDELVTALRGESPEGRDEGLGSRRASGRS
ncbi:MAG TPA: sigma-70 family RNA polymerase sigma factor [Natronosporangium sp.]